MPISFEMFNTGPDLLSWASSDSKILEITLDLTQSGRQRLALTRRNLELDLLCLKFEEL